MDIQPGQTKVNADVKADLTPAIQAGANLVDSSRKGIAKLFNAFVGPWIADRERRIAHLHAQTEKDQEDIRKGIKVYQAGQLLNNSSTNPDVDVYDELHTLNHKADAKRLQAAVEEAARQISEVPPEEIADEPISQTFFNRWRREAEMVDEDDLRQFWASLLVEEIKKPGSISPGTLEVARNLTRADALLFQRLCRGVVDNALLVDSKGNSILGRYSDLLTLQDAGLLNSQQSVMETLSPSGHGAKFFVPLRLAICSATKQLRCSCHTLTRAGMEIMQTIAVGRTEEDVIAMAKLMAAHAASAKIFVFRTEEVHNEDGSVQHKVDTNLLVWPNVEMR